MKLKLIIIVLLLTMLIMPALANDNPLANIAVNATQEVPVTNEKHVNLTQPDTSGHYDYVEIFNSTHISHLGRLSFSTTPYILSGGVNNFGYNLRPPNNITDLDNNPSIDNNTLTTQDLQGDISLSDSFYRSFVKENITLNAPVDEIGYCYNISLQDWTIKELVLNNTTNSTDWVYKTSYAKDSRTDINLDQWGNAQITINGAQTVVLPTPVATDASGVKYQLSWNLDKVNNTLKIDNLSVLSSAMYPVMIDPTVVFVNSGFESGNLTGWLGTLNARVLNYPDYPAYVHTGSWGAQVYNTGILSQDTTIPSDGNNYYLNFYYTSSGSGNYYSIDFTNHALLANYNGDNTPMALENVSLSPGSHTIKITALANSNAVEVDDFSIVQTTPIIPVASFTTNVASGNSPLTVQFTDTSTNTPTSWSWNFGDGTTSTSQSPIHTFNNDGNYTVTLIATNAAGSNTTTKYIVVIPTFTNQGFESGNLTGWLGTLNVRVLNYPDYPAYVHTGSWGGQVFNTGTISQNITIPNDGYNYYLNFYYTSSRSGNYLSIDSNNYVLLANYNGDNTPMALENVSLASGSHTIKITALANSNAAEVDDFSIVQTTPIIPVASFTTNVTSGNSPLTVQFTDTSTNTPTSWSWNFGDGTTSSSQSPIHTFNNDGNYTVTLLATNAAGSNTTTKYIEVIPTFANQGFEWGNLTGWNTTGNARILNNYPPAYVHTGSWGAQVYNTGSIAQSITIPNDGGTYYLNFYYTSSGTGNYFSVDSTNYTLSSNYVEDNTPMALENISLSPGTHTIKVTAIASTSIQVDDFSIIQFTPIIQVANFTTNVTSGGSPLTVQFTDTSTGNPTSWFWDFGDNMTSTNQNPVHTYNNAGNYTVVLTVTNGVQSNTTSCQINVYPFNDSLIAAPPNNQITGFPSDNNPSDNNTWVAGQTYPVSITFQNLGTMNWSQSNQIRLAGIEDAILFGITNISIAPNTIVQSGDNYTFSFNVTAPNSAGIYHPKYQMMWDGGNKLFGMNYTATVPVARLTMSTNATDSIIQASVPGDIYVQDVGFPSFINNLTSQVHYNDAIWNMSPEQPNTWDFQFYLASNSSVDSSPSPDYTFVVARHNYVVQKNVNPINQNLSVSDSLSCSNGAYPGSGGQNWIPDADAETVIFTVIQKALELAGFGDTTLEGLIANEVINKMEYNSQQFVHSDSPLTLTRGWAYDGESGPKVVTNNYTSFIWLHNYINPDQDIKFNVTLNEDIAIWAWPSFWGPYDITQELHPIEVVSPPDPSQLSQAQLNQFNIQAISIDEYQAHPEIYGKTVTNKQINDMKSKGLKTIYRIPVKEIGKFIKIKKQEVKTGNNSIKNRQS